MKAFLASSRQTHQNGRQSPDLQFFRGRLVRLTFMAVILFVTGQLFLSRESLQALLQTDRFRLLLHRLRYATVLVEYLNTHNQ